MKKILNISTDITTVSVDKLMPKRRCFRCLGRKQLHKVGSCYSMTDTGGPLVKCPLCNGEGVIKSLEEIVKTKPKAGRPKSKHAEVDCGDEKKES